MTMTLTTDEYRRKLIFRSWHRGTREMDLLMGSFADKNLAAFGQAELETYERLLENNDPDIYDWITGRATAPEEERSPVLDLLLEHRFVA